MWLVAVILDSAHIFFFHAKKTVHGETSASNLEIKFKIWEIKLFLILPQFSSKEQSFLIFKCHGYQMIVTLQDQFDI